MEHKEMLDEHLYNNLVYPRSVDPSTLTFSLSLHGFTPTLLYKYSRYLSLYLLIINKQYMYSL